MLKVRALLEVDKYSKLETSKNDQLDLVGPRPVHLLSSNGLYHLSNQKYLNIFLASLKEVKDLNYETLAVIIDEKLWEKLKSKNETEFASMLGAVFTTSNSDKTLENLTYYFYHQKQKEFDFGKDGRELKSAKISMSAFVSPLSFIGDKVEIEDDVYIHPHCTVMAGTKVKKGTILYPGVTLYSHVTIGEFCRIHSGCVIGADGFGYFFQDGVHHKLWHYGGVIIGDHVELGAQTCVDGGTFYPTFIGNGTKIDNQVQIGHNCNIGNHVIICGQSAIGGSTAIGDYSVFGGKSGTGHGLKIGKQAQIAGGALVNCDWEDGAILGGHPARPLKEWMKGLAYLRKTSLKKESGAESR